MRSGGPEKAGGSQPSPTGKSPSRDLPSAARLFTVQTPNIDVRGGRGAVFNVLVAPTAECYTEIYRGSVGLVDRSTMRRKSLSHCARASRPCCAEHQGRADTGCRQGWQRWRHPPCSPARCLENGRISPQARRFEGKHDNRTRGNFAVARAMPSVLRTEAVAVDPRKGGDRMNGL